MAEENKTVAGILKRVRRECNSYPLPNAAGEKLQLVREMNDAHNREIAAKDAEISELRECLRLSSNAMEMVVQWLGKYPTWQECLKNEVARNRKAMEGDAK